MKTIYFVRHGESQANIERRHGTHTTPLTEKGKKQAEFIAQRVASLPIQKIISSTMTRAIQTAEVVSQKLSLPIETSDLFVETRGPSELDGALYKDPKAIEAYKILDGNYTVPGFRMGDAEVFEDHAKRAQAALQLLAEQNEEHILVVAHGLFLRILIAQVLFGPTPSAYEYRRVMDGVENAENTSLTIFCYGAPDYIGETAQYPWSLFVWNDHAHLAE